MKHNIILLYIVKYLYIFNIKRIYYFLNIYYLANCYYKPDCNTLHNIIPLYITNTNTNIL